MIGVLIGSLLGLLITVAGTPLFIKVLVKRGYGQFVRDDGPTTHKTKRGTPTMGGAVIVFALIVAYFLTHWILSLMKPCSLTEREPEEVRIHHPSRCSIRRKNQTFAFSPYVDYLTDFPQYNSPEMT